MRRDERKEEDEGAVPIEASSGNVFADLGLRDPEELQAKVELVHRICELLAERKLTLDEPHLGGRRADLHRAVERLGRGRGRPATAPDDEPLVPGRWRARTIDS